MSLDTLTDPVLYRTRVINRGGIHGTVAADDGITLPTGPPHPKAEGSNPEQLLGMAWATCLGATVAAVLREQGADPAVHDPQVSVSVELHRDPDGTYRFVPSAHLHILGLGQGAAQALAEQAHRRCPVSRLLTAQGSPTVTASGDRN